MKLKMLLNKLKILLVLTLVVCALGLAYLITPFFGNKVLIVRSGSMTPTLPVGSLVALRPREPIASPLPAVPLYSPGDIISFKEPTNPKTMVTHRIVGYKIEKGRVLYQTKGDANKTNDETWVPEKNVLGSSFLTIPLAGRLFSFTKTKPGFLMLVLIPCLMVILLEAWNIWKEIRKKKWVKYGYVKNFKQKPSLTAIIPILAVGLIIHQTSAFFSDTAVSGSNVFAAATQFATGEASPAPVHPSPGDVVINEINWGGSTISTADEWIELRNTTDSEISLIGWKIENLGDTTTSDITIISGSIPANGFFLISNGDKASSKIDIDPDMTTTSISLANPGEQLRLRDNNNNLIDSANAAIGAWFKGSSVVPQKSMERKSPPSDGTQSINWQDATTSTNMDAGATESATPKAINGL